MSFFSFLHNQFPGVQQHSWQGCSQLTTADETTQKSFQKLSL